MTLNYAVLLYSVIAALHRDVLHYVTVFCLVVDFISLRFVVLQTASILHYITVSYIVVYCILAVVASASLP